VNKFLRFMAAAPLLASIGTTSSKAPSKADGRSALQGHRGCCQPPAPLKHRGFRQRRQRTRQAKSVLSLVTATVIPNQHPRGAKCLYGFLKAISVAVSLPRHGVGGANRSDLGLCIGVRRSRLGSRVSYGIPQRRKRRYCRSHLQGRPSGGGGLTALPFINAAIPRHQPRLADPPV
jgi:hypothetical protein